MKFPYKAYYRATFVMPLIVLACDFLLIVFTVLLYFSGSHVEIVRSSVFIFLYSAAIIFIFAIGIIPLSRGYSLAKEKESDAVSIQGVVQDITKMLYPTRYRLNGKRVMSQYIVIGNKKYYCMTADYVAIGRTVEIKYLPTGRFVLEIKNLSTKEQ